MAPFSRHFDFNLRRDHQKKSFECRETRDYESVDEKRAYLRLCPGKQRKKYKNSGRKVLMWICFIICSLCWMQLFSKWHMSKWHFIYIIIKNMYKLCSYFMLNWPYIRKNYFQKGVMYLNLYFRCYSEFTCRM